MLYFLLTQTQAHCQGEGNLTRARFPSIINNQIDNKNIVEQKKSSTTSSPNTSTFPHCQCEENLTRARFHPIINNQIENKNIAKKKKSNMC